MSAGAASWVWVDTWKTKIMNATRESLQSSMLAARHSWFECFSVIPYIHEPIKSHSWRYVVALSRANDSALKEEHIDAALIRDRYHGKEVKTVLV